MRDSKGRFLKGYRPSIETEFKKGQTRHKPKPYWNKEYLEDLYIKKQLTASDIAKRISTSERNILYYLKKHNIPRRTVSETRKNKKWGLSGNLNPMYGKRGKLSPVWQGGSTPLRQRDYSRSEWKELRKQALKRDNYRCQDCRISIHLKKLHIHHIKSFAKFPELRYRLDNLRTVCVDCHKEYNKFGKDKWQ